MSENMKAPKHSITRPSTVYWQKVKPKDSMGTSGKDPRKHWGFLD